jgi:hypothetical protein
MKTVEKILVILMLAMLVLPGIQKEYPFVNIKKLDGSFILAEKPELTLKSWYSGEFQSKFNNYIEDHIGFRDFLVRLTNQIDFSLYRVPHAEGVVIGKDDQLFEYDYIREYFGGDYVGDYIIDKKIRELKFLQEYLKKEKNIDLILVFEPGKASVYPEYIPDRYFKEGKSTTNSEAYLKKADEYGIKYIDFEKYFHQLKGNTGYPIYPQYGIHWSIYGMSFAADSLIGYIENLRQIDMPDVYIDSLEIEQHARRPDYDVATALNLLWRLPEKQKLAYPAYSFEENPEKERPMVLTVADSYYWNIFNTRIPKHLFKNEAFWYFNALVYPDTYIKKTRTSDLNLKEEIEKQDIIFLMVTKRFLYKFDWTFLNKAYNLYAPKSKYDQLYTLIDNICNDSKWFDIVIEKAKLKNMSLGDKLNEDANYVFMVNDKENFMIYKGSDYYMEKIKSTPKWLESVKEKAKKKDITVDEMIQLEADYTFNKKYPALFEKHKAIRDKKELILSDSTLNAKTDSIAKSYFMTFDEMLQIEAEKLAEKNFK